MTTLVYPKEDQNKIVVYANEGETHFSIQQWNIVIWHNFVTCILYSIKKSGVMAMLQLIILVLFLILLSICILINIYRNRNQITICTLYGFSLLSLNLGGQYLYKYYHRNMISISYCEGNLQCIRESNSLYDVGMLLMVIAITIFGTTFLITRIQKS